MAHPTRTFARTTLATLLAAAAIFTSSSGAFADEPERRVPPARASGDMVVPSTMFAPEMAPAGFAAPAATGEHVLANFSPEAPRHGSRASFSATARGETAASGMQASNSLKAGAGCSVQCITDGVAYARGAGAKLAVETDTPARIRIQVWNDSYFRIFDSDEDDVTAFAATFDDLEAGTHYNAAAYAWDSQGYMSVAEGSFETLTRNVEVSFNHANIIASPYGGDPYSMDVWVDGAWDEAYSSGDLQLDGSTLLLGINILQLEEVDRHLDFSVMLEQFDTGDHVCEFWPRPDEPVVAEAECYAWAYATFADGLDDLDDRPANADSWTEHTLERTLVHPSGGGALPPGYGYPLNFNIPVTLHVTYE